jgi:hypothetical protein
MVVGQENDNIRDYGYTVVKEGDGRFLQVGGCWVDVDGNVAREKVSHAFRSRRRIIAKAGA